MTNTPIVLFIIVFIWLIALSVFLFFIYSFFKKLSENLKEPDLKKTLEKIVSSEKINKESIKKMYSEIEKIKDDGFCHVQKIGLIRFNPFKEIGGDHSFSLAILDGRNNGIILTALHTRERTRVYSKYIKNGKCEFKLSNEEKKALLKAQKS